MATNLVVDRSHSPNDRLRSVGEYPFVKPVPGREGLSEDGSPSYGKTIFDLLSSLNSESDGNGIIPVGEHCEVVDYGRVEETNVVPATPDVLIWASSLATGALRLGIEVVIVGEALARIVVHPRDSYVSPDHLAPLGF